MYIGIDLGGTTIKIGLFDADFKLLTVIDRLTESETDSNRVMENIFLGVEMLLKQENCLPKEILTMGIGVPGLMDLAKGISLFSPNFNQWEKVPVVALLEEKFGIPTFMNNDVRMNLYGEWRFGAGRGKENVVLITIGTGLGAAFVVDGKVLYGQSASAGEFGHMNMYRQGRPCACGSSGCLGRYVSARGMLKTLEDKLASGRASLMEDSPKLIHVVIKNLSEAYDQGDQIAREVFQETGELLGFGLSNLINLVNPEVVIIGGGVANAGERLLAPARQVVSEHALRISQEVCNIVPASQKDLAGVFGAAIYAKEQYQD